MGQRNIAILDLSNAISRKQCKIEGKLVLIARKSHMTFRLVLKSVTLNDLERRNGRYFALFHRTRVRCRRKPITSVSRSTFDSNDNIKTICANIQRLFGQNKLITQYDGRGCIDD